MKVESSQIAGSAANAVVEEHPQDLTGMAVRALVLYSLAEFQSGHATTLHVDVANTSFTVADDGRGHAIDRPIGSLPYLTYVYTHMDYPFGSGHAGPVQLHAIGISLVNALCSELSLLVRKPGVTLRRLYRSGRLHVEELIEVGSERTGNSISGVIHPQFRAADIDAEELRVWLAGVQQVNPGLRLLFNGVDIASARSAA